MKVFVHLDSARINEYTPWESVYCGNIADIPTVIYSSGPALVLEFHSGSRTNNSLGFIGQFTFEDKRKLLFLSLSYSSAPRRCHLSMSFPICCLLRGNFEAGKVFAFICTGGSAIF